MNQLSVVLITKNSEKTIKESLISAQFADEIVVVDSGSKDKTVQIANSLGAKVVSQEWLGFGKQKQFALECATNEWIFVLDSDEIITKELQQELKTILQNPTAKAYNVARLNYFFNKPIKHCGLYPDYTLRFFNKNYAKFSEDEVHERVLTKEKILTLKNHMLHLAYEDIYQFIDKQNRYARLSTKNSKLKAIINPIWTFFRIYILKLGFLDGWEGFLIARLYSQYTFWKYIK